jgi:nucleoside 2-deoxyribosyltransferase
MDRTIAYHAQWREELTPFLIKLGFSVLNPYKLEPLQLKGLRPGRRPKGYDHWCQFGDSGDPYLEARFLKYMRKIIRFDINLVRKDADFLVVYWDEACKTGAGTHAEMTVAFMSDKPIYCVAAAKMPAWARGCCEEVFTTFDELKAFLKDEFGDTLDPVAKTPTEEKKKDEPKEPDAKIQEDSTNSPDTVLASDKVQS